VSGLEQLCRKALVQQVEILREKMQELKELSGESSEAL